MRMGTNSLNSCYILDFLCASLYFLVIIDIQTFETILSFAKVLNGRFVQYGVRLSSHSELHSLCYPFAGSLSLHSNKQFKKHSIPPSRPPQEPLLPCAHRTHPECQQGSSSTSPSGTCATYSKPYLASQRWIWTHMDLFFIPLSCVLP